MRGWGTNQCTEAREAQPNMSSETGMKMLAMRPISRRASGARLGLRAMRGSMW